MWCLLSPVSEAVDVLVGPCACTETMKVYGLGMVHLGSWFG